VTQNIYALPMKLLR